MSKEEPSFKSLRVTLSEEAFERLDDIMKRGSFRSYSSTVEECVRVVYEIIRDISTQIEETSKREDEGVSDEEMRDMFLRVSTRMARFIGKIPVITK